MKKYIHIIFGILLLFFPLGKVLGQNCDFEIDVATAPSTCQSNGTVTVTIKSDISKIRDVEYSLESVDFNLPPDGNNVLTGIPSGTYTVIARAFCIDGGNEVVRSIKDVVVGGNYQVPVLSLNNTESRKSYAACNTGIIAINVVNGSGNFTFNIKSAPVGSPTGIVTATKKGSTNAYVLAGSSYPAGAYQIEVVDGCTNRTLPFTLETVSGLPVPNGGMNSASLGFSSPTGSNCNVIEWKPGFIKHTENADFKRYYNDGMYEVAVAPQGYTPNNWVTWTSSAKIDADMKFPLSDFYPSPIGNRNISIHVRLKDCPSITKFENINHYYKGSSDTYKECDGVRVKLDVATYFSGQPQSIVCFPLSVKVTQRVGSTTVYTQNNISNYNEAHNVVFKLPYGGLYYDVEVKDGSGKTISNNYWVYTPLELSITGGTIRETLYCDYYTHGNIPGGFDCYPVEVTAIHPTTLARQVGRIEGPDQEITPRFIFDYNTYYTLEYKFENSVPLKIYVGSAWKNSPIAANYILGIKDVGSSSHCTENWGQLSFKGDNGKSYPVGTTFTVTGPSGYTSQTFTTTTSATERFMNTTVLPPGLYTAVIDQGCGSPITVTANLPGLYAAKNFSFNKQNSCSGLQITPTGKITYQSVETNTYYRIIEPPAGVVDYDKTVKAPGESFYLTTPGTYKLGIMTTNSQTACALKTIDVVSDVTPFQLDPKATSAYVCVGSSQGIIIVKAEGGFGLKNYTYELWNADNTSKINGVTPIILSDGSGRVRFDHGVGGESYTVRFEDDCGNKFPQTVTLSDLQTARIVSGTTELCAGETIQLNCLTLGNTTYKWEGPNGFTSTDQNPTITGATSVMSGVYKVTVQPEFCGAEVVSEITVNVYGSLSAGAVTSNIEVCVGSNVSLASTTTGGKNSSYVYQWQISPDGLTGWSNINGADEDTYIPPSTTTGTFYYRKQTTDVCSSVTSDVITVEVKQCSTGIPVNPNIRVRVK